MHELRCHNRLRVKTRNALRAHGMVDLGMALFSQKSCFFVCAIVLFGAPALHAFYFIRANSDGFGSRDNIAVSCLRATDRMLYAGTSNRASGEVWAYDGSDWTCMHQGKVGRTLSTAINSMACFKGRLHVGLWGFNTGDPWEVWCYDGTTWRLTNADTRGRGKTLLMCCALTVFNDRLYVVATDAFGDFELWSFDGEGWQKIIGQGCATPDKLGHAANKVINAMAVYRDRLYLGVANQKIGYQV